mmetsp:Transcript_33224/g.78795  ORF Transcript_33224/g.78795 Transcript_33224/m.78795 type:complete len:248 (+) Transcript_33224:1314-2057(+)
MAPRRQVTSTACSMPWYGLGRYPCWTLFRNRWTLDWGMASAEKSPHRSMSCTHTSCRQWLPASLQKDMLLKKKVSPTWARVPFSHCGAWQTIVLPVRGSSFVTETGNTAAWPPSPCHGQSRVAVVIRYSCISGWMPSSPEDVGLRSVLCFVSSSSTLSASSWISLSLAMDLTRPRNWMALSRGISICVVEETRRPESCGFTRQPRLLRTVKRHSAAAVPSNTDPPPTAMNILTVHRVDGLQARSPAS